MFEQVQRQQQAPVVVAADAADADLLVATLRVHGIEASAVATSIFPSIEFVEGRAVVVQLERWADAAQLLRGLGHTPLTRPDGGLPGP